MYIIHTHIIISYTLVIGIEAFVLYSREEIFDILPQMTLLWDISFALMRGRNQSQSRSTSMVLIVLLGTDK